MSLFKSIALVRISFSGGRYVSGVWEKGARTETPFRGTVQPPSGETLKQLPEGKRTSSVIEVIAPISVPFMTADQHGGQEGDRILYDGHEYEVVQAIKSDNGIIPHWDVLATRIKEGTQ